jgi:hypothetical protein
VGGEGRWDVNVLGRNVGRADGEANDGSESGDDGSSPEEPALDRRPRVSHPTVSSVSIAA